MTCWPFQSGDCFQAIPCASQGIRTANRNWTGIGNDECRIFPEGACLRLHPGAFLISMRSSMNPIRRRAFFCFSSRQTTFLAAFRLSDGTTI